MKNLFDLLVLLAFALICFSPKSAYAQYINAESMMIGGSLSFTSIVESKNNIDATTFTLNSGIAYFVAKDFALGLEIQFRRSESQSTASASRAIGPLARGYIVEGMFGQAQYIWSKYKFESPLGDSERSDKIFVLSVGYTAFLNNSIALEPMLFYSFEDGGNIFGLRIGFQIFLGRQTE